ncbi:hypothetical protein JMJ77_0013373 [Colletotrichum scovillei]|uniref:Uncharacterized protein n=1 Tax=Colletotrichum scovillei TaxID=1209932 RepID=A0A9P7UIK0_9PEZI|nr:hypothetical protein JMJ77_0013373 [Colletotrichum scovillei]KAG7069674.1 hypothetical protein JMJ76_0003337 [Colletotrichum scovillei]KAG7073547.1 hypothetical protein JMJ78_0014520 [Colletotrichum scovillei]
MKTCRWFGPTPSIWTAGVTRSSLAALYPPGADTSVPTSPANGGSWSTYRICHRPNVS